MLEKLRNWLHDRFGDGEPVAPRSVRKSGQHQIPRPVTSKKKRQQGAPDLVKVDPHLEGKVETQGPGKNVLTRRRLVREEAGTHDTLKILDDSIVDPDEQGGIDPYNTGGFDRSKKWDQRFRK